ncbi:MAG: 6-carboxytetrahydropterin synthase [Deltaproteobacteria bacterium]|nr:6-carboxytetrahydropterin synthase [bacterium]MCB9479767.1 6-carboxytetrahydropterin synthase [Deltaproteobacteria bacterium]MCB9487537.1 6-carboxytetrahydropterin synthase [Deltaproteobacteria bacterium]
MFEVKVKKTFAAAHNLREYKGKCEALHGHNWLVEVTARADKLDSTEIALDFVDFKKTLWDELEKLDHKYLNEIPPFDTVNPTSERLALYLFEQMSGRLDDDRLQVVRVDVWETENNCASYIRD